MNNKNKNVIITKEKYIVDWLKSKNIEGNVYDELKKDVLSENNCHKNDDDKHYYYGVFSINEANRIIGSGNKVVHIKYPKQKILKKLGKKSKITPELLDKKGFKLLNLSLTVTPPNSSEKIEKKCVKSDIQYITTYEHIEMIKSDFWFMLSTFTELTCEFDNFLLDNYQNKEFDKSNTFKYRNEIFNSPHCFKERYKASFLEIIYQLWEQHLAEIFYPLAPKIDHVNFNELRTIMKNQGYNLDDFESWYKILELKHVVNILKHGSGSALDSLKDMEELKIFKKDGGFGHINPFVTPLTIPIIFIPHKSILKVIHTINKFWDELKDKMTELGNIKPEKPNALSLEMLDEMYDLMDKFNKDLNSIIIKIREKNNMKHIFVHDSNIKIEKDEYILKSNKQEDFSILSTLSSHDFLIHVISNDEIEKYVIKSKNPNVCEQADEYMDRRIMLKGKFEKIE